MREELETLERERARIERQLRGALPPRVEAMLLDERRWVVRRRRALERVEVSSLALLRSGGRVAPCHVRDVSPRGAGVDVDTLPRVGERVGLVLTDLDGAPSLDAVVRHVTGQRAGLEFLPGDESRAAAEALASRFAVGEG